MGSYFFVIGEDPLEVARVHRRGVSIAATLGFSNGRSMRDSWARVTVFPRENGSGGELAVADGRWLAAAGTWMHPRCADAAELLRSREWKDLDGFFSIASGDRVSGAVSVVTDPLGRSLVFARRFEGAMAVATSSLLLSALGPTSLDPVGAQEFLHTGILYEERTLHREVRKLPPASIVRISSSGEMTSRRWWGLRDVSLDALDGKEAAEALSASLVRVLRKTHAKYPRLVSDLTGGYDSRAIACGLLEAGIPFETTVCGRPGEGDVDTARALALEAGLRHRTIPPSPPRDAERLRRVVRLTDGEYDAVEYSTVAANHEHLAPGFDASLNGSAGEMARANWWETLTGRLGSRGPVDVRRIARALFAPRASPELFARETTIDMGSHLTGVIERTLAGLHDLPNTTQMDWIYLAVRMRNWQARIASSSDRIWPVFSPFVTRDLLSTMLSMTTRIRLRSLVVRRMIAEKQPTLARTPLRKGYPPVPFGPKTFHRFAPMATCYARFVAKRVKEELGIGSRWALSPADLPPRLHLWLDDAVLGTLEPRSMAMAPLLEGGALREFLASSRRRDFRWDAEWSRLLTIESGERLLTEARRAAREDVEVAGAEEGFRS